MSLYYPYVEEHSLLCYTAQLIFPLRAVEVSSERPSSNTVLRTKVHVLGFSDAFPSDDLRLCTCPVRHTIEHNDLDFRGPVGV
jgi:hypothetical protein